MGGSWENLLYFLGKFYVQFDQRSEGGFLIKYSPQHHLLFVILPYFDHAPVKASSKS